MSAQIEIKDNTYTQVQECSLSAEQIYSKAKKWASRAFVDLSNVLKIDDAEHHEFVIKAIISQPVHKEYNGLRVVKNKVYSTLTVTCKDNKYRVKFEDLYVKIHQDNSKVPANADKHFEMTFTEFEKMANDLSNKYKTINAKYKSLNAKQEEGKLTKEEKSELKQLHKELVPLSWTTSYKDDVQRVKNDIERMIKGLHNEVVKDDDF